MKIIVFQQNESAAGKIAGIREYGRNRFHLQMESIDAPLPQIIDDTSEWLPENINADLVLDFLKHPDLSLDLMDLCQEHGIPVVASGKKINLEGVSTPPT